MVMVIINLEGKMKSTFTLNHFTLNGSVTYPSSMTWSVFSLLLAKDSRLDGSARGQHASVNLNSSVDRLGLKHTSYRVAGVTLKRIIPLVNNIQLWIDRT